MIAAAIALLWALHPLQTAAVTYVVQRAESMMGLFYLLTLYCFVRAVGTNQPVGATIPAEAGMTAFRGDDGLGAYRALPRGSP